MAYRGIQTHTWERTRSEEDGKDSYVCLRSTCHLMKSSRHTHVPGERGSYSMSEMGKTSRSMMVLDTWITLHPELRECLSQRQYHAGTEMRVSLTEMESCDTNPVGRALWESGTGTADEN